MEFSNGSDVKVVVTRCGRFDLLGRILVGVDAFDTAFQRGSPVFVSGLLCGVRL
ncbi:Uncharacterized protein pbN1_24440 [Aromatoleum bremense]|nr:Uncharacterized protein pbN1_24440 [Aromatoleum bremense]